MVIKKKAPVKKVVTKPVVKKKTPVKKEVPIRTMSFAQINGAFNIVAMNSPIGYQAPITKRTDGRYSARVLKAQTANYRTGQTTTSWEYFGFDKTGLITSTPRGFAKEYKNVRITDIEEFRIMLDPREKKAGDKK